MDVKAEWLHPAAWYYRLECEFRPNKKPLLKVCNLCNMTPPRHLTLFLPWQGVNLTCTCDKMYSPPLDSQRYCSNCSKWFHVGCMELSQPETQSRAFKPAPQQLAGVPIMRGWNGNRNGKSWETVGTGRKLVAVKAWLAKDVLPKNWREQLDDQFVTAMTEKIWALYTCPKCSSDI